MAHKDKEYEQYVQSICQLLLNADGLETVKVQHDIQLEGSTGQKHQIDVYWEYRKAGVVHKVAIECKNYKSSVSVGRVRDFFGVLNDVPNLQGLVSTTVGYQSGAVTYAEGKGIGLRVIRAPKDGDWQGRIRKITLDVGLVTPIIHSTQINFDEEWVKENLTEDELEIIQAIPGVSEGDNVILEDIANGSRIRLHEYLNNAFNELPLLSADRDSVSERNLNFTNAFVVYGSMPRVKLHSIVIRYQPKKSESFTTSVESDVKAIVRDALTGRLQFIDEEGRISGDE